MQKYVQIALFISSRNMKSSDQFFVATIRFSSNAEIG